MKKNNTTKTSNIQTSRDTWLRSAADQLRPYFEKLGYSLPEKMRFTVGFTSGGKHGMDGECWYPPASADQHYEIIIKISKADPAEVLGILVHELVHTLLPPHVKHGKEFRDIALRIGLEGKMTHARPAAHLHDILQTIVNVALVSPIVCPIVEDHPGPTVAGRDGQFTTAARRAELAAGALTLQRMRVIAAEVVDARRNAGDPNLHLVDGLALFGADDASDLYDGLHPTADGYLRIGERFHTLAFTGSGPFSTIS